MSPIKYNLKYGTSAKQMLYDKFKWALVLSDEARIHLSQ